MTKKKNQKSFSDYNGFIALFTVFLGISLYGIFYFYNSTDLYLSSLGSNVLDSDTVAVVQDELPPAECVSCPRIPLCEPFCDFTNVSLRGGERYEIFKDVWSDHKNAVAIEFLYKMGIINGYADGTFKPEKTLNRAELLTVLTNAVDADFAGGFYDYCFVDVKDEWFAPYVCYAKKKGWVRGYFDGAYRPADTIDKASALKICMEAFEYDIPDSISYSPMEDVSVDDWYAPYVKVAFNAGILGDGLYFNASHRITRAEIVQIVYNAMVF